MTNNTTTTTTRTEFDSFWSEGVLVETDGGKQQREYDGLNLHIGNVRYEIGVGDVVVMRSSTTEDNEMNPEPEPDEAETELTAEAEPAPGGQQDEEEDAAAPPFRLPLPRHTEVKVGDGLMLARVERIFRQEGGRSRGTTKKVLFQARWFLKVRRDYCWLLFLFCFVSLEFAVCARRPGRNRWAPAIDEIKRRRSIRSFLVVRPSSSRCLLLFLQNTAQSLFIFDTISLP